MMTNRKQLRGLYAITDPELMVGNLLPMAEQAIHAGISILQYRNKTATLPQQEHEANELALLCKKTNVLFLINDNAELAVKVNADGVHLGQKDGSIKQARSLLGEDKIIGVTCHNQIELAQHAEQQGADYVAFGRFFASQTKPDALPADLCVLTAAKKSLSIPVVAIGGITADNAENVLQHGADMLAVIHSLFAQDNIAATTKKFNAFFEQQNSLQAHS